MERVPNRFGVDNLVSGLLAVIAVTNINIDILVTNL